MNIRWADGPPAVDPGLAFMLAQQRTTQLQLDVHRLDLTAEAALDPGPVVAESELSLHQITALKQRISPFANCSSSFFLYASGSHFFGCLA